MSSIAGMLPTAVAPATAAALCIHCGDRLPPGADRFCCAGCAGAYALIHEMGLDRFYRDRAVQADANLRPIAAEHRDADLFAIAENDGTMSLDAMLEGVHCPACVWLIESVLARQPDIVVARVNLTSKRLHMQWRGTAERAATLMQLVERLGYRAAPYDPARIDAVDAPTQRELLRATAVAGFAAANVMLLSVSIWAGFGEMGPVTRTLFHWISAAIALPAIAYAGQPFFRSAMASLRAGRTNMDVAISIGLLATAGISLFETTRARPDAYFDSAVALLFFLLIGRYLDSRARGRARSAAEHLLTLSGETAARVDSDGRSQRVRTRDLRVGDHVLVVSGERVPVDGSVASGVSTMDRSLVDGETLPVAVRVGDNVLGGMLNLGAAIEVRVEAVGDRTFLAEMGRLIEAAEQGRARLVLLAEKITRLYTPAVHVAAFTTFAGWLFLVPWETALLNAVSVLIVTCPCALGIAVPAVQVIASERLLRRGILLKSATALERLATIDTVVFDKTGTLTEGKFSLMPDPQRSDVDLRHAASLAASSLHPLCRALVAACTDTVRAAGVKETPGQGLSLVCGQHEIRLGSRAFCGVADKPGFNDGLAELWFVQSGRSPLRFAFADRIRPDAETTIGALRARGKEIHLLSGDRPTAVAAIAEKIGIANWRAGVSPAEKCAVLSGLAKRGRNVLMVGDGLNDAPALAAALVSLSPASGADIAKTTADVVFQGTSLGAVITLLNVARRANGLVYQNIILAIGYNAIAVPLAIFGLLTPLIAAIAMSSSSLVVVLNALRLSAVRERPA